MSEFHRSRADAQGHHRTRTPRARQRKGPPTGGTDEPGNAVAPDADQSRRDVSIATQRQSGRGPAAQMCRGTREKGAEKFPPRFDAEYVGPRAGGAEEVRRGRAAVARRVQGTAME